jgi:hypothetical protein
MRDDEKDGRTGAGLDPELARTVDEVREYWDARTLGVQYVSDASLERGTREYFDNIRPWMNPYKFPWIMERIEAEAEHLRAGAPPRDRVRDGVRQPRIPEAGGPKVTATDLTPAAVATTKRHFELEGCRPRTCGRRTRSIFPFPTRPSTPSGRTASCTRRETPPGRSARSGGCSSPGGACHHLPLLSEAFVDVHRVTTRAGEHRAQGRGPAGERVLYRPEILAMFEGFRGRVGGPGAPPGPPRGQAGVKAVLYRWGFRPLYNLLPEKLALRYAYKLSVTAVKP